jgi:uncharacterized membrane protein YraQ (UPF0718 family)
MKRTIMTAVVLLALIPAVLIGYAVNYYIQNTVRADKLDALAGTVHMMATHSDKYYARLVYDVERKTETAEIKNALAGGSDGVMSQDDRVRTEEILKEFIGVTVYNGSVIDRNGKTVFSTEPGVTV